MVKFKGDREGPPRSTRTHINLAENIFLYTTKSLEPLSFLYEIESATINTVKITIHFGDSTNICALQDGNILSASSLSSIAQPFQRCIVGSLRSISRTESTRLRFSYEWSIIEPNEDDEIRNKVIIERQSNKIRILVEEAKLMNTNILSNERRNLLHLDVEFPPMRCSYSKTHDVGQSKEKSRDWLIYPDAESITWRRAVDFMIGKYNVFIGDPSPSDIREGLMKNRSFLCSIACLVEHPLLMKRIILPDSQIMNPFGKYQLQLYDCGLRRTIVIDDYFPCYPNSGPICSRGHNNELWILLIEKAFAKMYGSYHSIKNRTINEIMTDLTGCPYGTITLREKVSEKKVNRMNLWNRLQYYADTGCLLSVTVPRGNRLIQGQKQKQKEESGQGQEEELGLELGSEFLFSNLYSITGLSAGYSYAILRLAETSTGIRLLQLRNPWGAGGMEWNGDWSDTCPLWTEEIKVRTCKESDLQYNSIYGISD